MKKFKFKVTGTWIRTAKDTHRQTVAGTITEADITVGGCGALAVVLKDLFFDHGFIACDKVTATIQPVKSKI